MDFLSLPDAGTKFVTCSGVACTQWNENASSSTLAPWYKRGRGQPVHYQKKMSSV